MDSASYATVEQVSRHLERSTEALREATQNVSLLQATATAAEIISESLRRDGRIFTCGNGGSMSDAMHLAEELTGRFRADRRPYAATAISDPAHLTCTANDFGYEHVFSRYIAAHGRRGDVFVGLSTSGQSANVIAAFEQAKALSMTSIALTGQSGSRIGALADLEICSGTGASADLAQEIHIKLIHAIVESTEILMGDARRP